MKQVTIVNKRIHKKTKRSIVFTTSGYGGKFFNIPKSLIEKEEDTEIYINDNYSEKATLYFIPKWLFKNIKGLLINMNKYDVKF